MIGHQFLLSLILFSLLFNKRVVVSAIQTSVRRRVRGEKNYPNDIHHHHHRRAKKGECKTRIHFWLPDGTIAPSSFTASLMGTGGGGGGGLPMGSVAILNNDIYTDKDDPSTVIGRSAGTCTLLDGEALLDGKNNQDAQWYCAVAYQFLIEDGDGSYPTPDTINVGGPFYSKQGTEGWNGITGGTGKYLGASGQANYVAYAEQGWVEVTFYLDC